MSNDGMLGKVNTDFTGDSSSFSAAVDVVAEKSGVASKQMEMATKVAKRMGDAITQAGNQSAAAAAVQERAHARAVAAWQREVQRQNEAIDAEQRNARAMEMAALKADILARANEKLGLSANPVIAQFQAMARGVSASMTELSEKMVATAERAELSADGIAAAFGGLGKLLGGGIAVGFAAHALDQAAELNVKLGDLSEKTGIAVQTLAGLRLMAQSKGLDFDTIGMGLTRLGKAMYEARQGAQQDVEAFSSLGISMKEVQSLSVEQMFYRVSKALGENRSMVVADGTALELFGRGGKEVIPVMREWGGQLEAVAKKEGGMTGVTQRSVAASQQWLQATSELSASLHSTLMPVLVELARTIPYVETGWNLLLNGINLTLAL